MSSACRTKHPHAAARPAAIRACEFARSAVAMLVLALALSLASAKSAFAQCGIQQSCCFAHNGRGCSEPNCCQAICAADPFCCTTRWDAMCAATAQAYCGVCGVGCGNPNAGNCCAPKTTPACSNAPCCSIVCSQDAFCCDGQWDEYCAAAAEKICGICADPCGDPDSGDCCIPHDEPGCNNPDCCEGLCSVDPFCCQTQWDAQCAFNAQIVCGVCGVGCGDPAAGNCCEAHATPACADPACCVPVCAADSFCCDVEWDANCASLAIEYCGVCADECGSPITGACCVPHDGPSCDDATCCNAVCAMDAFCCEADWDTVCANKARQICGVCGIGCGEPSAGSCCAAKTTPSCSDELCCSAVCSLDGFCCDEAWDASCAEAADILCGDCGGACGNPAAGSCCTARTTPGCSDDRCCLSICLVDPPCCSQAWDNACAQTARQVCGVCGPGCGAATSGDCCAAHTTPSCSDAACCATVCAQDPFCCESEWDTNCAEAALDACAPCSEVCGAPGAGDCCTGHATAACSDAACCELICAADSFCCNIEWDNTCAAQARTQCMTCRTPGDLNGDGVVNSADLAILLSAWGTPGGDLDGDGFTSSSDIGILLTIWG